MGANLSVRATAVAAVAALSVFVATGCSSDDPDADDSDTTTTLADGSTDGRPDGPAAAFEVIDAPGTPFIGDPGALAGAGADLEAAGFVEEELVAAGTATSYRPADGTELTADGAYELVEHESADYRTRVLVRRPADAADFNGTVVVEWLNVSGGLDANPDWTYTQEELLRGGYAWVGVSAQLIGIEGGPVAVSVDVAGAEGIAGAGLRAIDPERYGSLSHPGDAFAYDIFTQVGRTVRSGEGLGDLEPELVVAVGESQSAFALTTYANGVQPLTGAFDGFLVHSRGGAPAGLGEPGGSIDIAGSIGGEPTTIRTDLTVPVLVLETETDVVGILGFRHARQPDTDLIRVWEVAGTAHVDAHLLGAMAAGLDCPTAINDGPHHFVVKSALRWLADWAAGADAPPSAEPIELDDTGAAVRDDTGIVLGGIRTPAVDVPVATQSGEAGAGATIICLLLGSSAPLAPEVLVDLHGSAEAYLEAFEAAANEAVDAGFVLPEDLEALLATADPSSLGG